MDYKIIISDRQFNVKEEIHNRAYNVSWDYNRIGGCGRFSFTVPTRYCNETALGGNYNVKIQRRIPTTGIYETWYQGRIENKIPSVKGVNEAITVSGFGYQSQLKDIYVDDAGAKKVYTSQEISVIVTDILDNYITSNTDITYSGGDISATSFTPDSIEFSKDALDCFNTLADITGSREWGVDADRKFFFKERSSTSGFRYRANDTKVLDFSIDNSSKDIVNRVIILGGDVAGSPFVRIVNDAQSQLKWNRRDRTVSNSAIVTNAVADQFADAIFAEFSDISLRTRIKILEENQFESTVPIPLFEVIGEPRDTYGTKKYGSGLYNAVVALQVNRISYKIDKSSNLTVSLQLGKIRPSIAEDLSQLKYNIDQLSSQSV